MEIGFVSCHHGFGERISIEDGVHHSCKAIRVCVMEECHKKSRLSVSHQNSKRSVWDFRRLLKFYGCKIEQGARTLEGYVITTPNGVSRLDLAYTFRTAASRDHYGKPLFKPVRQTDESQLRNPAAKVGVRQFMREHCRETLALGGE